MSPRPHPPRQAAAPGRTLPVAAALSVVATLASVGAVAVVLTRNTDADPCRSLAWAAVPDAATLPEGWTLTSNRFFVDNATLTLLGPAPSGATEGVGVYISMSCYGSDARLALSRARQAALATGAHEQSVSGLGDDAFAVVNESVGTIVYVRRGDLVADITAPPAVEQSTLEPLLYALDTAMAKAMAAGPPSLSPDDVVLGGAPSPAGSAAPSAGPDASPSPTPVPHVAPDLEARLPRGIEGTAFAIDSVTGAVALGDDPTSKAFASSLQELGKTPADLQIARALDPAGDREIRVYAFRLPGTEDADLLTIVKDALLANETSSPTASDVTVGGVPVTRLSYDQGPAEYLITAADGVVFNIETTDETLAATVLQGLSRPR